MKLPAYAGVTTPETIPDKKECHRSEVFIFFEATIASHFSHSMNQLIGIKLMNKIARIKLIFSGNSKPCGKALIFLNSKKATAQNTPNFRIRNKIERNCLVLITNVNLVSEDKIILGIDPGTTVMGYGLIHIKKQEITMVNFGIIQLKKLDNHADKLKRILDRLNGLILEFKPDEMAIEAPFFGKNVQSMLKLGRAQGVAIAAALNHNIPYEEYSPRRIKQAITGKGGASKEQVAAMLQSILEFDEMPKYLDATDGLAVALCHHYSRGKGENNKNKSSSWAGFIQTNPKRLKK